MAKRWIAALLAPIVVSACIPDLDRTVPGADVGSDTRVPHRIDSYVYTSDARPGDAAPSDASAGDGASGDLQPPDTVPPPDSDVGKWYQVDSVDCSAFCSGKGLNNVPGPEGSHCMSGEVRSASGLAQGIKLTYGCTGGCGPLTGAHQATSYGKYCYKPGQKHDNDDTDRTVGCFCAP